MRGRPNPKPDNVGEATLALQVRALKLPEPVRNFRFHATRKWEIDFAWPSLRFGVEIDGGIYGSDAKDGKGAHSRPAGILRDMAKHNALLDLGWRVYRVTPREVKDGTAFQLLEQRLGASKIAG